MKVEKHTALKRNKELELVRVRVRVVLLHLFNFDCNPL